jgi:hypothetical protein
MSAAKPPTLPPVSVRALDYLHAELAVVLAMAAEIAGGCCPLEALPRIASKTLDDLLFRLTAETSREIRALVKMDTRAREVDAFLEAGGEFYSLN